MLMLIHRSATDVHIEMDSPENLNQHGNVIEEMIEKTNPNHPSSLYSLKFTVDEAFHPSSSWKENHLLPHVKSPFFPIKIIQTLRPVGHATRPPTKENDIF